ncbi:calcium-binding protein P-like [Watersipora subatra]|uniref:calcium-binding protein P-like n=1 Tax=Watersipora subatra TaxID=2589382 RepID=UPI00355BB3D2
MSSYGGSRYGSRDDLDEGEKRQPQPQPRRAPTPQSRKDSASNGGGRGAPPSYGQYEDTSRVPTDRYGERLAPRRYEERPQDQYYPSRSHSPTSNVGSVDAGPRYDGQPRQASRSQSPARYLEVGAAVPRSQVPPQGRYAPSGYAPSQSGYAPSQSGYAPSQSGYAASQSGYAPSQGGYAPPQGGYAPSQSGYAPSQSGYAPSQSGYTQSQGGYAAQGYAPQGGRPRGPSSTSGYQPMYQTGGRSTAPSQSGSQYVPRGPPTKNYYGHQQYGRGWANKQYKQKSVTRDGGYYNVYTDAVVKTKKLKSKGVPTTFLAVTRPWSKNHSNQPRDFMPLVIASIFFNPLFGLAALVISCMTMRAVTEEDWATAGLYGRVTFWMSITAIITGIIFFIALIGAVHNDFVPPMLH